MKFDYKKFEEESMIKADKEVDKIKDDLRTLHKKLVHFSFLASNCNSKDKVYQANKLFQLHHLMVAICNGERVWDD